MEPAATASQPIIAISKGVDQQKSYSLLSSLLSSSNDPDKSEVDPNVGDPANNINMMTQNVLIRNYVNNTNTDGYIVTGDEIDIDERLRSLIKCYDRPLLPATLQRGDFWVLQNYIRADHGELKCYESITYTTHSDYTFLDNLLPMLER